MPTVAEVLKSSGFDDAAIAALDQRAITAFNGVLTTAQQDRDRGELAQRAATELFEKDINPALNAWGNREASLTAERDYYKTLAEKGKDAGFIQEVPPFQAAQAGNGGQPGTGGQPRNPNDGRWTQVPGSPDIREFENRAGSAIQALTDLQWKYQSLYGSVLPDAPSQLVAEAAAQRLSLTDYASRKYDFTGKEKAIGEQRQKEHDDKIRKEAAEERDKHWAERTGNNPNIRQAEPSRFAELRKGVADGSRPDPLKLTADQRRAATRNAINADRANASQAA